MRILVVEDERTLAGFIEQSLHAEGHATTVAHDGEQGELEALTGDYALVLLDLMLPGKGGLDVLDAIRARKPELPVIVLTSQGAIEQRVEGLDRGANDYVTKPFSFEELLARSRALIRRSPAPRPIVLQVDDVRLDPAAHRVWRREEELTLTTREFALLEAFMRRPGEVLSRFELLEHVWDDSYENRSNVIDVYVGYLRDKLDRPFGRSSIETVRGAGYRLRADDGH
jgi:two-component system OmpR family response regulator